MFKKFRVILLIICVILIVGGGLWGWRYLHLPTTLPIRAVKVVGEYEFVDQQALQKTVIPFVTTGFFNVNIRGAEAALLQIPGVSVASLRRVWPDKIEIQVTEKKAQAILPDGQIYATDGSVFMPFHSEHLNPLLEKKLSQLPVFAGSVEDLPAVAAFYQQAQRLLGQDGFRVNFVGCDELGSWTVGVTNMTTNMTIVLGRDHLLEKLARFTQNYGILEKTNQNKIPILIDLRYNLGFAAEYSS